MPVMQDANYIGIQYSAVVGIGAIQLQVTSHSHMAITLDCHGEHSMANILNSTGT